MTIERATLAEKFIVGFDEGQWAETDIPFPFGFSFCLRGAAENGDGALFKRVVDSYIAYSQKINKDSMTQEHIKLEALSFVEFQCIVGDTGRMSIGIPIPYKMNGPTRKMFLDIYSGQLAEDKGYNVTQSIIL